MTATAYLERIEDGEVIEQCVLGEHVLSIGRHADNDIVLGDDTVSNRHAIIEFTEDYEQGLTYHLRDLGSTNGTFLNERKVSRQRLRSEDRIRIGWATFRFVDPSEKNFVKTKRVRKTWLPRLFVVNDG